MKCNFCKEKATRVTVFHRLTNNTTYHKEAVCEEHYFEFHHGLATVKCPTCKMSFMLDFADYYDMPQIFCCHCSKLIPEDNEDYEKGRQSENELEDKS